MKQNYNACLQRVLKDEGGYTNDPRDPGGPTNFGITIFDYRKYINSAGTAKDVKNMSVDQAKTIYKSKYWDALSCDTLPSGVDYTCFDYGVNSGLGRPRKALQRFKSLSGVQLIDAINNERMAFLHTLKTFPHFGLGWTRRVEGVRAYSKKLATDNVSGPITGGAVATGALTLSQFWHQYEIPIIIGGIAAAAVIAAIVHYIRNRNG